MAIGLSSTAFQILGLIVAHESLFPAPSRGLPIQTLRGFDIYKVRYGPADVGLGSGGNWQPMFQH